MHFSQTHRKPFNCGLHSTQKRDHIKKALKPPKVFLTSDFKRVLLQNCTRSSCLLIIWSGMSEIQLISLGYTMKCITKCKIGKLCWVLNIFMPNKRILYFPLYQKCRQWCAILIWKLEFSEGKFSGFFFQGTGAQIKPPCCLIQKEKKTGPLRHSWWLQLSDVVPDKDSARQKMPKRSLG